MSFIDHYHLDLIEATRQREKYAVACRLMWDFIKDHSPVVGHDEVTAFNTVKKAYMEATRCGQGYNGWMNQ